MTTPENQSAVSILLSALPWYALFGVAWLAVRISDQRKQWRAFREWQHFREWERECEEVRREG